MSDATFEAVEEAIRAHMAEEHDGALMTQWVVIAYGVDAKHNDYSFYKYMSHQGPRHEVVGLLQLFLERIRRKNAQHEDPED